MYRILNSGSEFLFGILLETSEAARDWNIENIVPVLHRHVFLKHSMEMRAIIVQARAQLKHQTLAINSLSGEQPYIHRKYFHSCITEIRKTVKCDG